MNRNKVKTLSPIIKAFSEGKTIQSRCIKGDTSLWYDDEDPSFDDDFEYRIKPEPTYRPFKDPEECLQEMLKHQPFGWIKRNDYRYNIISISDTNVKIINTKGAISTLYFSYLFLRKDYHFIDGTLFGVKVEE